MSESGITSPITNFLRDNGCFVMKHSDHFTTGTPDTAVVSPAGTTWLEFKKLDRNQTPLERVMRDKQQFFNMRVIAGLCRRAYYIFSMPTVPRTLAIYHPEAIQQNGPPVMEVGGRDYDAILRLVNRS